MPNAPNLFTERLKMHERYLADLQAVLSEEGQGRLYPELLAGIRPDGAFDSPSFEEYMSVVRRLDDLGVVRGLGLKLGDRKRNATFGFFGIGFLTQASLWEMGGFSCEAFSHCWGHYLQLQVFREGEFLVSRYLGRPPLIASDPLLVEQVVMTGVRVVTEELPGQDWSRCRASFAYPPPPHRELYARFLPFEVRFDQPFSELLLPWAWAARPLPMANDRVRAFCESSFHAMVEADSGRTSLQRKILNLLIEAGASGSLDLSAVSCRLGISERSLQAALTREGTSFRRLQNEVLVERAKQMLSVPGMSVKEIAFALGFSQAANFSRAFARATGMSPEQFRSDCGF
ncbi:helix-turn-helix domain-containing protein [Holophaga foetida]|uniref:helix-turn-helix domain-containing protein n=1 Tax=Holophaga foetida TaxID=35839 RepID=UPI0002D70D21|nr:AraC family transcriptional regulator [Holophaga foetida]